MGMFDEIRCEVPLPDAGDADGILFQSKSFPEPCLQRFTITGTGRLIDSVGNDIEPEGYVTFYTTDQASALEANASGRRWREYRARFVAGQLQNIVRVDESRDNSVRYGLASFRWFNSPSLMFGEPTADSE
jgi:hypothetical protein